MKLVDNGIIDSSSSSIQWRQLIIFNTTYDELKKKLNNIEELVEFDLPSEMKITSILANQEFVPLTGAIYCPWIDKQVYKHFNVGYNKTTNKCCINSFNPGEQEEAKLFIKIAEKIPCFYMDGTFGPNEMVFLAPKDFKDEIATSYRIIENNGEEHFVGQMISGRYFVDDIFLNADYVRNCVNKPDEFKQEWIRKHTTRELDVATYITNQTNRFVERVSNYDRWITD